MPVSVAEESLDFGESRRFCLAAVEERDRPAAPAGGVYDGRSEELRPAQHQQPLHASAPTAARRPVLLVPPIPRRWDRPRSVTLGRHRRPPLSVAPFSPKPHRFVRIVLATGWRPACHWGGAGKAPATPSLRAEARSCFRFALPLRARVGQNEGRVHPPRTAGSPRAPRTGSFPR